MTAINNVRSVTIGNIKKKRREQKELHELVDR
jgi:hypothetical protein